MPLGLAVAGANRHDMRLVEQTLDSLVVDRPQPTAAQPQGIGLDKGYEYAEVRDTLTEFSFTAYIRARGEKAQVIKQ